MPVALRSDIVKRVRSLIGNNTLEPGARVNESQLSVRLGISRTPLREALSSLEGEGLVRSEHERGFFVAPLSSQEVREIYPIGRELDLLALRTIRRHRAETLRELRNLNRALLKAKHNAEQARTIDTSFHRTLIGGCPNKRLLAIVAPIQASMERYERLYMRDENDIKRSCGHHDRIIVALERDDIDAASAALADNWNYGFERILQQLEHTPLTP